MNRIAVILSVLALVCGCSWLNEPDAPAGQEYGKGNVYFVFSFEGALSTKASDVHGDSTINTAQVAVFDGNRQIGYGSASIDDVRGEVVVQDMPLGKTLDCYVVANVTESVMGMTKSEIEAMEVALPSYRTTSIPMFARGEKSFSGSDNSLSLQLRRAASKIEIQSVKADFVSDKVAGQDCILKGVYLSSAPGRYRVSLGEPAGQVYYHAGGFSADDETALGDAAPLVAKTGIGVNLKDRGSYEETIDLYCCPTSTDVTSVVFWMQIGNNDYHFAYKFDKLEPNKMYLIRSALIKGADVPDPITEQEVLVDIEVAEWVLGDSVEVPY